MTSRKKIVFEKNSDVADDDGYAKVRFNDLEERGETWKNLKNFVDRVRDKPYLRNDLSLFFSKKNQLNFDQNTSDFYFFTTKHEKSMFYFKKISIRSEGIFSK